MERILLQMEKMLENVLRICIEKRHKNDKYGKSKAFKRWENGCATAKKCTEMAPWAKKLKMAQKNFRNSNKRELGKGPKGLQKGKEMINSFLCKETNATKKAAQKKWRKAPHKKTIK